MNAEQFYQSIQSMEVISTCVGCERWDEYMNGTVKADATKIERLVKKHLPDFYYAVAGNSYNPFRHQHKRKEGMIVYVWSATEYFIQLNHN